MATIGDLGVGQGGKATVNARMKFGVTGQPENAAFVISDAVDFGPGSNIAFKRVESESNDLPVEVTVEPGGICPGWNLYYTWHMKNSSPIVMENLFHANPIVPVWLLTSPLYQLSYNDFAEVHITKVAGRVAVREGRRTASIAEVRVSSTTVKPGDALDVYVTLKPFGAASVVKTAKLTIPRDTKPGTTVIVDVCDASTSRSLDRAAAPGRYRPRNLAQLVRIMAEREPNTHLFVRATLPTMGVTIRGEPYPALPAAMMSALAFSNATGVGPLRETVVERVPTQWVLSGRQQRRILVQEETER